MGGWVDGWMDGWMGGIVCCVVTGAAICGWIPDYSIYDSAV
jgi:hypothetical protein